MPNNINISDGQNIWDITLQEFGDLEKVMILLTDNDLNFNFKLKSNQNITINNSNVGNDNIKNFYKFSGLKLSNDQTEAMPPNIAGDYNDDYNNDYL